VRITLLRWCRPVVAVSVLLLAGCGSLLGSRPGAPSGSATSTPTASASGSASGGLTEFGALASDWNAHHHPDPKAPAGVAYNPSTVTYAAGPSDQFVNVSALDTGRVIQFSEQFARRTALATARAAALAELPKDAKIVWLLTLGTCLQEVYSSRTLGAVLSAQPIGDPKGLVLIEYQSGDSSSHPSTWNAKDVTGASFSLGTQWPNKVDAPPC
jgi:hypothetical protein